MGRRQCGTPVRPLVARLEGWEREGGAGLGPWFGGDEVRAVEDPSVQTVGQFQRGLQEDLFGEDLGGSHDADQPLGSSHEVNQVLPHGFRKILTSPEVTAGTQDEPAEWIQWSGVLQGVEREGSLSTLEACGTPSLRFAFPVQQPPGKDIAHGLDGLAINDRAVDGAPHGFSSLAWDAHRTFPVRQVIGHPPRGEPRLAARGR